MIEGQSSTLETYLKRHWPSVTAWFFALFFIALLLLDSRVSNALKHWPEGEQDFFRWITQYGEGAWVLVPAFVLWIAGTIGWRFLKTYWWRWTFRAVGILSLFTFAAVGIPGLITAILKRLFGRARPVWLETEGALSFRFLSHISWDFQSFPSGHATTSFAFALVVTLLIGRCGLWVFVPAFLIALSRVVIQMHYLSDIVFGAGLGLVLAWAVAAYWRQRDWVFRAGPGWQNRLTPLIAHQWRRMATAWFRSIGK